MGYNVFADLDLPKPDEHFLRSGLLLALAELMRNSGLTQGEIAAKAGLKQPEVSRIMNGSDRGFSTDRLARVAFKLGYLPTIDLRPMSRGERATRKSGPSLSHATRRVKVKKAPALLDRMCGEERPRDGDEHRAMRRKARKHA
jgi:predicted XRE-type DNA-binding protein